METSIVKGCLYCGLRLPDTAHFCPECGRPVEVVIRFDNDITVKRTAIKKGCLYCGLQLADDAGFCPECGRPVERDHATNSTQDAEVYCPDTEKHDLAQHQNASFTDNNPIGHKPVHKHNGHMHLLLLFY